MLLRELSTGGVDVIAARVSNGCLYAHLGESADKELGALLSGGLEPGVLKIVQLNEVDVSKGSSREVAECLELSVVVVHTTDEGVLVRRPSARGLNVLPHDVVEALERVLLDAGHDRVSGRLNGGMKGDGKRELLGLLGEAPNHGDDTAGRYREMTSADSGALGRVQHAEGLDDLIIVIEGLALAHHHNA